MPFTRNALYVRRHFPRIDQEAALALVEDLFTAFRGMLAEEDWMEAETRRKAQQKAFVFLSRNKFSKII